MLMRLPAIALLVLGMASLARAQSEPYYYALENQDSGAVEGRGLTNGGGFSNLLLQADTNYRLWLLRRADLKLGSVKFKTPRQQPVRPGFSLRYEIPSVPLERQPRADRDRDGLSDAAEAIVGTSASLSDTDGDGINDTAEVQGGSNPTDGITTSTGIVARAALPVSPFPVVHVRDDVALVASSDTRRLHVFNVFLALPPREVARVSLPNLSPVGVYKVPGRAIVAGGTGGMAVVDLSDPPQARIEREIQFPGWTTTSVAGADTLGILTNTRGSESELVTVDLETGAVLHRLPVLGAGLREVTLAGDHVIAVSEQRLHVFSLSAQPAQVGSVSWTDQFRAHTLTLNETQAIVGRAPVEGPLVALSYRIFDISTPTTPLVVRDSAEAVSIALGVNFPRDLALDSAGNLLFARPSRVSLIDLTVDPEVLGVQFEASGVDELAVYNGHSYLVTARALEVLSYVAPDRDGIAPTISMTASFPLNPSPIAEEGQLVRVTANVQDDVQIRTVEFFQDGIKRSTVGSPPFDFRLTTPRLATQSASRIRARVFDTGGNSTWSDELVVTLTQDQQAPSVVSTDPPAGGETGQIGRIQAVFSEPMSPGSLTTATFMLVEAGPDSTLGTADDVLQLGAITQSLAGRGGVLTTPSGLAEGTYRATLDGATDSTGNALLAFSWDFTVEFDDHGNDAPSATQILLGEAVAGTVDSAADEDWFFVELGGGVYHELAITPPAAGVLELFAADGATALGTTSDTLAFTPAVTGPFLIRVTGSAPASYQIEVRTFPDDFGDTAAEATALTLGQAQAGAIQPPGSDRDVFSVDLSAGQDYDFTLSTSGGAGVLRLVDLDGTTILQSSTTAPNRLTFRVPPGAGGTYYLFVEALFGVGSPSYTLMWQSLVDDHGDTAGTSSPLVIDVTTGGVVEPQGDADFFSASLAAGVDYTFTMTDLDGSLRSITLFDADGTTPLGTAANEVEYASSTAKTVFLRVTGTGAYQVGFSESQGDGDDHSNDREENPTPLQVGGPAVPGVIGQEDDIDVFVANLVEGTTYEFRIRSTSLEEFEGELVVDDDGEGSAPTEGAVFNSVVWTAAEDGQAYFEVFSFFGTFSPQHSYEVQVRELVDQGGTPATAAPLGLGELATGMIEDSGDADMFGIQLTAGQRYSVSSAELRPGGGQIMIGVYDSGGSVVDTILEQGELVVPTTGTYFLDVLPVFGNTDGNYWIYVVPDDDTTIPPLTLGAAEAGTLSGGTTAFLVDEDAFTVDLVSGRSYRVEIIGSEEVLFELRTPDMSTLVTDARSQSFVAPESGTFNLSVLADFRWRYPAGDYTVRVVEE